ncbi:hypothetical protein BBJ28_00004150 [Nothophytophthora sp. Chile5]|nr:hypothetical protein BBJ28_00004150 [Nothophytophthora sp. Chile5]
MATKGDHEKPETVDEHQPVRSSLSLSLSLALLLCGQSCSADLGEAYAGLQIAKKVRLDVDAKVTEDVKKNDTLDADSDTLEQADDVGCANVVSTAESETSEPQEDKVLKPNTSGSAFGGFSAFSGKNAFSGFTSSPNSNGFGSMASSSSTAFSGFGTATSSGMGGGDASSSSSSASPDPSPAPSSSGGFAAFQSSSSVSFSSFAASQPSSSDGFGTTTSSVDFSELDANVEKKAEPVVPALTEAEKRAKLFKLVDKDYAEVGIGPLRVLNAKDDALSGGDKSSARIVMRRESYARGPGTKLLINASLSSCLVCEKKTEKTMLLTMLEASEDDEADKKFTPVTYLMRFGAQEDLDLVLVRIQAHMHSAAASSS